MCLMRAEQARLKMLKSECQDLLKILSRLYEDRHSHCVEGNAKNLEKK